MTPVAPALLLTVAALVPQGTGPPVDLRGSSPVWSAELGPTFVDEVVRTDSGLVGLGRHPSVVVRVTRTAGRFALLEPVGPFRTSGVLGVAAGGGFQIWRSRSHGMVVHDWRGAVVGAPGPTLPDRPTPVWAHGFAGDSGLWFIPGTDLSPTPATQDLGSEGEVLGFLGSDGREDTVLRLPPNPRIAFVAREGRKTHRITMYRPGVAEPHADAIPRCGGLIAISAGDHDFHVVVVHRGTRAVAHARKDQPGPPLDRYAQQAWLAGLADRFPWLDTALVATTLPDHAPAVSGLELTAPGVMFVAVPSPAAPDASEWEVWSVSVADGAPGLRSLGSILLAADQRPVELWAGHLWVLDHGVEGAPRVSALRPPPLVQRAMEEATCG